MAHPVIFFEVLAKDEALLREFYTAVFGWQYEDGKSFNHHRFGYVAPHFDNVQVRGGIGFAPPGGAARATFYVQVDNLEATLKVVTAHGGRPALEPTGVDGYRFATFEDPELNTVGIVEPFPQAGER